MALASVVDLSFAYPAAPPALRGVSLELEPGEVVALFGPSGSGKSTLLRALAGLVPHFHGGRFSGRVVVAGLDTRTARPAELAGTAATVFQDPEDQVVMTIVANEVAFGLENLGTPPDEIWPRVERALASIDALHLWGRKTIELSGGELQRVCLASALALEPQLLLLDEPTSQLDPDAAALFLEAVERLGATVVLSEHRVARALELATRVVFVDEGRIVLDAARAEALAWLAAERPRWANACVSETQAPVGRARRSRSGTSRSATARRCRCSSTSISTSAAARSSSSRGRTAPARRRSRGSPRGCSSRRRARSRCAGAPAISRRIPAAISSRRRRSRRSRSPSTGMNSGLAPRSTGSGSAGRRRGIRATSRAASASGLPSPPSRSRSPTS